MKPDDPVRLRPASVADGGCSPNPPDYLQAHYRWAYVTPRAIQTFERQWLVNLILWGHYRRLQTAALAAFTPDEGGLRGNSLQVACVYGDLTARWLARHAPDGRLDVIDVLPQQLANLRAKLARGETPPAASAPPCRLIQANSAEYRPLAPVTAYDRALLFFLLHEQPEAVRRATLAATLDALRPGGELVVVDYHRPKAWHPLHWPMRAVLAGLEPFALDLWQYDLSHWLPAPSGVEEIRREWFFGGLYQLRVWRRPLA